MLHRLRLLVSALLLSSACAPSGGSNAAPSAGSVDVRVTNRNALPMVVFVSGSGINHRLGTVHPGMNGRFVIPQNLVGNGSVQFEARPSGGGGQPFRSGEVMLAPGASIEFQIAPAALQQHRHPTIVGRLSALRYPGPRIPASPTPPPRRSEPGGQRQPLPRAGARAVAAPGARAGDDRLGPPRPSAGPTQ